MYWTSYILIFYLHKNSSEARKYHLSVTDEEQKWKTKKATCLVSQRNCSLTVKRKLLASRSHSFHKKWTTENSWVTFSLLSRLYLSCTPAYQSPQQTAMLPSHSAAELKGFHKGGFPWSCLACVDKDCWNVVWVNPHDCSPKFLLSVLSWRLVVDSNFFPLKMHKHIEHEI